MNERAGAGDPTPTLELLWGMSPGRTRGPQRSLTPRRIVEAAVAIADRDGFEALSMRRVAADLGVGPATLYSYVPGKAELLALMLDAAIATDVLPHERPGTWREQLAAWARSDWRAFLAHPWALQLASTRPLIGPNLLAWFDSALSVLDGIGLVAWERAAAVQSIDAFVRGHARLVIVEGDAGVGSRAADPWQAAQRRFLEDHVDFGRYPAVAEVLAGGDTGASEAGFEFGLGRLLDGIEALAATRRESVG